MLCRLGDRDESAALGVDSRLSALRRGTAGSRCARCSNAFEGTMRTPAMIMAILLAAYFLNFVITSIG